MTVVTMTVESKMKEEMLNNWRAKTNYGAILTQFSGQSIPEIGDSIELSFGEPTVSAGGRKIIHEESGGTDLIVGNNTTVTEFRITRDNTNPRTSPQAVTNIGELYTYGGVFRVNKIEIVLT